MNEEHEQPGLPEDVDTTKEYEVVFSAKLRFDKETKKIMMGWKPITGNLAEVPIMLREYMIGLILSSVPEENRLPSAGMGVALSKGQNLTPEAAAPRQ